MLSAKRKVAQFFVHSPPRGALQPKILCATDLSSRSEQAVARALNLCASLGGRALLLHVVASDVPLRLAGRRADRAHSALQWQARKFSHLRVKPDVSVRIGQPVPSIVAAAESFGADLIVLGLHRERMTSAVGGSTAERLACRAKRPVLVVNTDAAEGYHGVTFVAGRRISLGVQLADRFELFNSAHVSFVLRLSLKQRIALSLADRLRRRGLQFTQRIEETVHTSAQRAIENEGLHLMGFEFLSGRATPRMLLSRIARGRKPQLLVAGVGRNPLRLRELGRLAALLALRTRACDVLLFPERPKGELLRGPAFFAQSDCGVVPMRRG